MKPKVLLGSVIVEVAGNSVANVGAELINRLGFSEYGMAERSGQVAALRCLVNDKNDLVHNCGPQRQF
jgi:hypothetical protein